MIMFTQISKDHYQFEIIYALEWIKLIFRSCARNKNSTLDILKKKLLISKINESGVWCEHWTLFDNIIFVYALRKSFSVPPNTRYWI